MNEKFPIGVFDSGYGGLTVFKEIAARLPQYDYIYLGDNARVPYGSRSFETVYQYTWQCVQKLFAKGCRLVILACNTSSAKALRSIQQNDLPKLKDLHRVLGVIRPTTEIVGKFTRSNKIGVLATAGTVSSSSYPIEIAHFYPEAEVFQEACPMWVPLVENNEHEKPGADYFIKQHLDSLLSKSSEIDTIILGCTHYPLLINKIRDYLPEGIQLLSQGALVAQQLEDYLSRHPEIKDLCSTNGRYKFYTTESVEDFNKKAGIFFGREISAGHLTVDQ